MNDGEMNIAAYIRELAVRTGAPDAFVFRVKALFTSKGIRLDEGAEPYVEAIEFAFLIDDSIRQGSDAAVKSSERLETGLERYRDACARHAEQLRAVQAAMERTARRLEDASWKGETGCGVLVPFRPSRN